MHLSSEFYLKHNCHTTNAEYFASLTIKGQANEEAVLCTSNKTYAVRSVVLSNSVLVVTRPPADSEVDGDAIVIRDQVNEILELTPSVPKLHKLGALLRGMEYDEGQEDGDEGMDVDGDLDGERPVSCFLSHGFLHDLF